MCLSALFDKSDLVANTESVLEEQGAAKALECALAHDADTVTEHVSLVHVMCRQNDNSVLLVRL